MSLANEVLSGWAPVMRTVELRSASGGRFEVTVDGELVFSKAKTGRFPRPGEVVSLLQPKLGQPLHWR